MANQPGKSDLSLAELLRLSEELQTQSAKVRAEAKIMGEKSVRIAEHVKRIWDKRYE
jgi:phage gp16-like protein